ncbi:MAG: hypothetical protein KDC95_07205 [Planctomycetes bacterium]|nr:hypothetical protein [Planctomycetota bacterium]
MITNLTIQPTFDFSNISPEAVRYESSAQFKRFVTKRLASILGACDGRCPAIRVDDAEAQRRSADFGSYHTLCGLVGDVLTRETAERLTASDGEPPIGPECRPSEEDPNIWIKSRGIFLHAGPASDEEGPLVVGDLDKEMNAWPRHVRHELAAMRLYVRVQWHHRYAAPDGGTPGDAPASSPQ